MYIDGLFLCFYKIKINCTHVLARENQVLRGFIVFIVLALLAQLPKVYYHPKGPRGALRDSQPNKNIFEDHDGGLYPGTITQVGLNLRVERRGKGLKSESGSTTCSNKGRGNNHAIIKYNVFDKLLHFFFADLMYL